MRPIELNLASRPFVNEQPVLRTAMLLWLLGLALLALNVTLYYRHIEGRGEQEELLRVADERLIEESAAVDGLRSELAEFDLESQNEQVRFLNTKIAERVFSWSELFDRLAEVVPAEVQMGGIAPRIIEASPTGHRSRLSGSVDELVAVGLRGTSQSPEAVLELVDAFFAHPSFFDPDLTRETTSADGVESFVLSVKYLPGRGDGEELPPEVVEAEPPTGGEDGLEADEDQVPGPAEETSQTVEGGE